MFKDQITTIDGEHGIIFVISPQNKFKGRKPNWFCKLNPTEHFIPYTHPDDNFQGFTPQSQAPILIPYPGAKMCPYEY
ncbi:hypothetical protein RIR_jg27967.t1 [Rhizophagus irregularis DAOM 181602=DAOM 197198]|nr:hypothetical protein RIR_jg27967.t1 [Rhizophagus irregularis DAOM 181602=DAOM 197198]CAB4487220.1 unnamed protein product [Rhizophagus irregularis]